MRASPPFEVCLIHFGVWRGAVALLATASLAALAAWWLGLERPVAIAATLAVAVVGAAVTACAASLARVRPASLRWDGRGWHLGAADPRAAARAAGRLTVALDFGGWMLLRFDAEGAAARSRTTWLPVQRFGLAPHWHALRCAVHAPQPAASRDGRAGR